MALVFVAALQGGEAQSVRFMGLVDPLSYPTEIAQRYAASYVVLIGHITTNLPADFANSTRAARHFCADSLAPICRSCLQIIDSCHKLYTHFLLRSASST